VTVVAWVDVREAWKVIDSVLEPLGTEEVPIEAAAGRVVREVVRVDRDLPPFDRAAMDGFAVRAADVTGARADAPARLRVIGEATPGAPFGGAVTRGHTVRIMTGAAVPQGADGVVPVEETSGFAGDEVEIRVPVGAGSHVTPRGRERHAGEPVFSPGRRLTQADVGALAMVGIARVRVGRRARVALLSTGNELVPHAETPGPAHIRNSNAPMLEALASPFAAAVKALGIAGDTAEAVESTLRRGLESDLLIVSGGVSMGAYDHVSRSLSRVGVQLHFERVALQPGKPTTFGSHAEGAVLALPGNPVSALTTFRLFGAWALRRLEGESAFQPDWYEMAAHFDWERRHAKWLVLPGRRVAGMDGGRVETVPYAGSGDLLAYARADCQIVLPPDRAQVRPGQAVLVWPL
jgi:molybdopterin molybdotransferase